MNLLLAKLININVILFPILELFSQLAKFLEKSHFLNLNDSYLGRHVNVASRKSLEIQAYSITKPIIIIVIIIIIIIII